MILSLILTINDRHPDVSRAVADSLRAPGNQPDELIIVLDRATDEARAGAMIYSELWANTKIVEVQGDPGWLCPAKAWNAGFSAATGDLLYCISSDTVQAPGNVEKARALVADGKTILHGKAECSCGPQGQEVNWGGTAPGNLFGDAAHPRPLGFIWAGPAAKVKEIGGFDLDFMRGLWHDDDDFFFRLWNAGVDFLFDDSVHGIHLHHERPHLDPAKIAINQATMLEKHGTLNPWNSLPKQNRFKPGQTRWGHL